MEMNAYGNTSTEVDVWFGVNSPVVMITILSVYLLLVFKIVPNFMKNREPYSLKTFITVYNLAQVIACVYVVQEVLNITSTKIFYFWKCSLYPSNSYQEHCFNRLSYFAFWLKIVELSETIVFVLRKKQNQVSFLHVFHHCSTVSLIYFILKNYRHGQSLYPLFLNSNVHIIMYTYYLATAVCTKETLRTLQPIKKSITTIQMIQFVLILTQAASLSILCNIPRVLAAYYCTVVGVIFYGFYDFYQKNYVLPNKLRTG